MVEGAGREEDEAGRMSGWSRTELRQRKESIGGGLVRFICRP